MGRPMKEGLDYFPHDTDAVNDEKIETIKALFGAEGYAFYFIALERIYRTKNGQLEIGSREKRASLTAKIGVDDARFMEILSAAFEVGLFDRKAFDAKGLLTSKGVKRRVRQVNDERERKRQWKSRKIPAEKSTDCSEVLDVDNSGTSAQRKEKKSKEKKSNNIPPNPLRGEVGVFQAYAGEDAVLLGALKDFDEMRRRMKKPMTDRAKNMLLKKLDELATTSVGKVAHLEDAVLHCWLTVYPPRTSEKNEEDPNHGFI